MILSKTPDHVVQGVYANMFVLDPLRLEAALPVNGTASGTSPSGSSCVLSDETAQSLIIGDTQHWVRKETPDAFSVTSMEEVLAGRQPGWASVAEITLFNRAGVGWRGLSIAQTRERGRGIKVVE